MPTPQRHAVPLAVWPARRTAEINSEPRDVPPNNPTAITPAIAARIVAEYSCFGDSVLAIGDAIDSTRIASTEFNRQLIADLALEPARRATATAVDGPESNDIYSGCPGRLHECLGDLHGVIDLVIASPLVECVEDSECTYCESRTHLAYMDYFDALRPGGHLVTVTRNERRGQRFVDVAAATVQGATSAGFEYLQHNIALLCSVTGSGFATRPSFWENRGTRHDRSDDVPHSRVVHADVNVFVKPGAASV